MASSRARRCVSTSTSPATFVIAISQSSATAPKTSHNPRLRSPSRNAFMSHSSTDQPASVLGNCAPSSRCTRSRSSCACSSVTPGFIRPMPERNRASRKLSRPGRTCAGSQTSTLLVKAAGMTPTIGKAWPPIVNARPMTVDRAGSGAPRMIAHHRRARSAEVLLRVRECPSDDGFVSEDGEEARRHAPAIEPLGLDDAGVGHGLAVGARTAPRNCGSCAANRRAVPGPTRLTRAFAAGLASWT